MQSFAAKGQADTGLKSQAVLVADQDFTFSDTGKGNNTLGKNQGESVSHHSYTFTEADIRRSSARDLLELLNTIPDVSFGADVGGILGISIRGNNASEAIAVVVDGTIINEGVYATVQLAGKFQLDQLKQVEVLIGPQTIGYGGWACYAAINIQTIAAKPFTGIRTGWTQGFHNPSTDARVASSISAGKQGPSWSVAATGSVSTSVLSFRPYTDIGGVSYNMASNSSISSRFASVTVRYRQTSLSFLSDNYQLNTRDAYVHSTTQAYANDFSCYALTLRHQIKLGSKLSLALNGMFKNQDPYKALGEVASKDSNSYSKFWVRTQRILSGIQLRYVSTRHIELTAMAQGVREWGFDFGGISAFEGRSLHVAYNTLSTSGQATYATSHTRLSVGGRMDEHSYAGLLPSFHAGGYHRVGLFYGKLDFSLASRVPTFMNVLLADSSKHLSAQRVQAWDAEVGLRHPGGLTAGIGAFHYTTLNGVAYQSDDFGNENYRNLKPYGTQGVTFFVHSEKTKYRFRFDYTAYATLNVRCSRYEVPGKNLNLGAPGHKGSLSISGPILKGLDFSLLSIFECRKYGITGLDSSYSEKVTKVYTRYPARLTLNLFIHYQVGIAQGLELSLGLVDALNQSNDYVQPYAGYHMPLPGPSREYIIRVSYAIQR